MKIAITSTGKDLDAQVDPRFGRCQFFLIVDTDTMEYEALENEQAEARGGAGIQAGQFMAERGVKAVLTGNCGPNAFQALSAADIEIFTGVSGVTKEAIERLGITMISEKKLEEMIDDLIKRNKRLIEERGKGAFGPLMAIVMKKIRGRVKAEIISKILKKHLEEFIK